MNAITALERSTETQWPSGLDPEPFAQAAADQAYVELTAGAYVERMGDDPSDDSVTELREALEREAYTRRQLPRLLQALKRHRIAFELGAGELVRLETEDSNTLVAFRCPVDGGQVTATTGPWYDATSRLGWLSLECDREDDMAEGHQNAILAALDFQPLPLGERDTDERVDWDALWLDNMGVEKAPRWLIEGVMERGELAALFGAPGCRKSLLALLWVLQLIRHGEHVLYLDRENPQREVYRRLMSMGATPAELARLEFRSFPDWLVDTEDGAAAILRSAAGKALVVFDSWARFFASGNQSDDGPANQAYANVLLPLRAAGVAVLRLDHTGVADQKRPSGTIVKTADIDHGWHMNTAGDSSTLTHTKSRSGQGVDVLPLAWLSGPLRVEAARPVPDATPVEPASQAGADEHVRECVETLDGLSIAEDASATQVTAALRTAGRRGFRKQTIQAAQRVRRTGS